MKKHVIIRCLSCPKFFRTHCTLIIVEIHFSFCIDINIDECPFSWMQHDGFCYYVAGSNQRMNFTSALSVCRSMGADLTSFTSQSEIDYFTSLNNQGLFSDKYLIGKG